MLITTVLCTTAAAVASLFAVAFSLEALLFICFSDSLLPSSQLLFSWIGIVLDLCLGPEFDWVARSAPTVVLCTGFVPLASLLFILVGGRLLSTHRDEWTSCPSGLV